MLVMQQTVSTHKPSYITTKIENKTKRYMHNIKIDMYSQNKVIDRNVETVSSAAQRRTVKESDGEQKKDFLNLCDSGAESVSWRTSSAVPAVFYGEGGKDCP